MPDKRVLVCCSFKFLFLFFYFNVCFRSSLYCLDCVRVRVILVALRRHSALRMQWFLSIRQYSFSFIFFLVFLAWLFLFFFVSVPRLIWKEIRGDCVKYEAYIHTYKHIHARRRTQTRFGKNVFIETHKHAMMTTNVKTRIIPSYSIESTKKRRRATKRSCTHHETHEKKNQREKNAAK